MGQFSYSASYHPCCWRTCIIAPRISFHVFCRIITSFGNIQPSQQICLNFLVSSPSSFRSQYPASFTISNLPLGSVAKQCLPVLSCDPVPCTVPSFWAT